jgi:DNA-binding response OmpR family regulator
MGAPARAAWLVLARDGPALEVRGSGFDMVVRAVGDPALFQHLLLGERPRIVLCAQPPADDEVIRLVAAERRRRSTMRAVHLAPPDAVEARLAALAAGFDEALTTTTPAAELLGRLLLLEAAARRQGTEGALLPVAEGLGLDLAAHALRRGPALVHLRPKEYGLLAMLARHPGRAYSRRELLDRVWGPDHQGGMRTVDVHVRWLRSKIEPEPDRPIHLVTVRGVGYRLDAPRS